MENKFKIIGLATGKEDIRINTDAECLKNDDVQIDPIGEEIIPVCDHRMTYFDGRGIETCSDCGDKV